LRDIEPRRCLTFQFHSAPHDVVPHLVSPFRHVLFPPLRGIFRWIQEPNTICFGVNDLDVPLAYSLVQGITLGCDAVAVYLPSSRGGTNGDNGISVDSFGIEDRANELIESRII